MAHGAVNGRPAINQARGLSEHGRVQRDKKARAEFAQAENYTEIRAKLASDEARVVLDELVRWEQQNKPFFLWTELHDMEAYCNAHARYRLNEQRISEMQARGEEIPMQLTKRLAETETMQYAGLYILHKQAVEDRRAAGNALALTKLVQAKVAEEIKAKQMALDFDSDGPEIDEMTTDEMEAELAGGGITINLNDERAKRAAAVKP